MMECKLDVGRAIWIMNIILLLGLLIQPASAAMTRAQAEVAYQSYIDSYAARGGVLDPTPAERERLIQNFMTDPVLPVRLTQTAKDYERNETLNSTHYLERVFRNNINAWNVTRLFQVPAQEPAPPTNFTAPPPAPDIIGCAKELMKAQLKLRALCLKGILEACS